jgi:hypothetical protein
MLGTFTTGDVGRDATEAAVESAAVMTVYGCR